MALKPRTLTNDEPKEPILALNLLSERQLLQLRSEIDAHLNLGSLEQIDIGQEIAAQLRTVKLMQASALTDDEAAYGQKAQAAMVVVRLLQDLTKMRTDLHNAERFMQIENAIIEALKDQPVEVKDTFFTVYEKIVAQYDIGLKLVSQDSQEEVLQ